MDRDAVLAAHDRQVRRSLTAEPGLLAEDLGRVVRCTAPEGSDGSRIAWSDVDEATADAEIAAQIEYFAGIDRAFEWKTYDRDRPLDLGARLVAAGFVPGAPEAFVVGELPEVLEATAGHSGVEGVEFRPMTRDDLPGVVALAALVWGDGAGGMFARLLDARDHDRSALELLVAEEHGVILSCGWVRMPGNDFASLWGGTTHPDHRGRGIYRALVRRRALLAAAGGHRWLQVECTDDSLRVLRRLGLRELESTTPYRWRPGGER